MPSRTMEDKVEDLTRLVSGLVEQARALDGQLNGYATARQELEREVSSQGKNLAVIDQLLKDLRGWKDGFGAIDDLKIDIKMMRRDIDEIKKREDQEQKRQETRSNRVWGLGGVVLGAVISGAFSLLVLYLTQKSAPSVLPKVTPSSPAVAPTSR